jgi:hypothetical protein
VRGEKAAIVPPLTLTLSPQRVERGWLTGYGDREIENFIAMTEFAKAVRRVYSNSDVGFRIWDCGCVI